jgi:hypothetical protein
MGIVHNPPIIPDTVDTIVENRRFFANMTGARPTDYFIENGLDYLDSRARWDLGRRVNIGTSNFNVATAYIGAAWVAPFACTLKGFTAIGTITTGHHPWEANLTWHDATYPITATNTLFTSLVTVIVDDPPVSGDMHKATGTCDQLLAEGDLVLPAVRRDGYDTSEQLYGSFSFWFERVKS